MNFDQKMYQTAYALLALNSVSSTLLSCKLDKLINWTSQILDFTVYIVKSSLFLLEYYTVSNKNKHLADFETCVFRGYLRNTWAIKKLFTSICILVWRAFWWKSDFWNLVTKSADIFKNAVLPEKSKLLEKIRHFEKIKNFFHGSNV